MIDENGHARLADFGLLTLVSDPTNTVTSHSATNAGTTRWMSPELLYPEHFGFRDSRPTTQSDYYAFGMVILEVLSGEPPFPRDKEFIVMRKVVDGERPERPGRPWFTDDLWSTLEQCWSSKPNERPTAEVVLKRLSRVSKIWQPLLPRTDDPETDSDESVSGISICTLLRFAPNVLLTIGKDTEDEAREDVRDDILGPFAYPSPPPKLVVHPPHPPESKGAHSGVFGAPGATKHGEPDQAPARTGGAMRYRNRRLLSSPTLSTEEVKFPLHTALLSRVSTWATANLLRRSLHHPTMISFDQMSPLPTLLVSAPPQMLLRRARTERPQRLVFPVMSTCLTSCLQYVLLLHSSIGLIPHGWPQPQSRPGSPTSSEDMHIQGVNTSARDRLRVEDAHYNYRPLSHRHVPVSEPPPGFVPFNHSSAQ